MKKILIAAAALTSTQCAFAQTATQPVMAAPAVAAPAPVAAAPNVALTPTHWNNFAKMFSSVGISAKNPNMITLKDATKSVDERVLALAKLSALMAKRLQQVRLVTNLNANIEEAKMKQNQKPAGAPVAPAGPQVMDPAMTTPGLTQ